MAGRINPTLLGAKSNSFRPKMPNMEVVKAFGRLVVRVIEPLGHPGAVLIPPLVEGRTYQEGVQAAVGEFDQAVADQELWSDNGVS